jgi:acetyl-CoA carboxylase biotin carboxyl carrier protein
VTLAAKDVAEILRLLEDSSFDELSLEMDGMKVTLRRGAARTSTPSSPGAAKVVVAAPAAPLTKTAPPAVQHPGSLAVTAPLLGIFYRAPKPGDASFVEVGARVEAETIIGIIEVMKLMNTVRAGVSGTVVEIAAGNGELVEFGEVLLRVRQD